MGPAGTEHSAVAIVLSKMRGTTWRLVSLLLSFACASCYRGRFETDLSNDYETVKITYHGEFDCSGEACSTSVFLLGCFTEVLVRS